MVTIREYKEFCARKIIVIAFQKHISQLKNNCQDTFYFYSLCRKSDRQFLVVQMHFWVSEDYDCSSCWNIYVKIHEKELGRSKLEQTLLKDCRQTSFYLSWPTLHTSQVYRKREPNMIVNSKLQSTFVVFIHQASKKIISRHCFSPCSLYISSASTTFVCSYLYDKLLQRATIIDPRKSKSNIVIPHSRYSKEWSHVDCFVLVHFKLIIYHWLTLFTVD